MKKAKAAGTTPKEEWGPSHVYPVQTSPVSPQADPAAALEVICLWPGRIKTAKTVRP